MRKNKSKAYLSLDQALKQLDIPVTEVKPPQIVTKIESCPTVSLIVLGDKPPVMVHGLFACQSQALASMLSKAGDDHVPVLKHEMVLPIIGQTVYDVTFDYVSMVLGAFYPEKSLEEIIQFKAGLTDTMKYWFVVSC